MGIQNFDTGDFPRAVIHTHTQDSAMFNAT